MRDRTSVAMKASSRELRVAGNGLKRPPKEVCQPERDDMGRAGIAS